MLPRLVPFVIAALLDATPSTSSASTEPPTWQRKRALSVGYGS